MALRIFFGDTDVGTIVLAADPGGDPLTTAEGFVVDDEGAPLADFEVALTTDSSLSLVLTDAAGFYSLPGVAATDGGLVAAASGVLDGRAYRAEIEDPAAPVPGGTTLLPTLYPFGEDGGGDG